MALATEVECFQGDTPAQSFEKVPCPDKSVGSTWDTEKVPEDAKFEKSPTLPQDHDMGLEDLTAPSPQPATSTGEQKLGLGKDAIE